MNPICGVYVLRDDAGSVLYVGVSSNVWARLSSHRRDQPWADEIARVDIHRAEDRVAADKLETRLIHELKPTRNIVLKAGQQKRPKVTPPAASLAAVRASLGLTQDDICKRVEAITNEPLTKGALSGIENGQRGASAETLAAIESAMGMRAGSLIVDYEPSHSRRKPEGDVE